MVFINLQVAQCAHQHISLVVFHTIPLCLCTSYHFIMINDDADSVWGMMPPLIDKILYFTQPVVPRYLFNVARYAE